MHERSIIMYWKEIRNTYRQEPNDILDQEGNLKLVVNIDAWKTNNNNEEGEVIAKVLVTTSNDIVVVYNNYIALDDDCAQQIIKETIEELQKGYSKENNPSISKSFAYELGVMMFNAYRRWHQQDGGFETNEVFLDCEDYDICGNFLNLVRTLGIKDMDILKDGFIQESLNHQGVQELANEMFESVKTRIQED